MNLEIVLLQNNLLMTLQISLDCQEMKFFRLIHSRCVKMLGQPAPSKTKGSENLAKLTIEQLESLLEQAKNRMEYGNMKGYVLVGIKQLPSGNQEITFEQPCQYSDCSSSYYRFSS